MAKTKPLILMDVHFWKVPRLFHQSDQERLTELADLAWGKGTKIPLVEAEKILPGTDAIVAAGWQFGAQALALAKNLRVIVDVNGAWPDLDYEKCREKGIYVLSTAPSFGYQVAEMALGMTLGLCREICIGDKAMRDGTEEYVMRGNRTTSLLRDKKVGFVGFGSLARSIMHLLTPFNCVYQTYYPSLAAEEIRHAGCVTTELDELLETSDVIYVVIAPSEMSTGILDRRRLALIRSHASLLLMSRASVVDFDALTEFVLAGRFKAGIDVFPTEPVPKDHPIREANQAILSAHRAGTVTEGLYDLGRDIVDDLAAIFTGFPPHRLYEFRLERTRQPSPARAPSPPSF